MITAKRQAEPGVAQAVAGRAQEARLGAQQLKALQEAPFDAGRDPSVGGGTPDSQLSHHVPHRYHAMTADKADQLQIPAVRRPGPSGLDHASLDHGLHPLPRRMRPLFGPTPASSFLLHPGRLSGPYSLISVPGSSLLHHHNPPPCRLPLPYLHFGSRPRPHTT